MKQSPEFLVAEVRDDGCGFWISVGGRPNSDVGLGLLGIRERAILVGGTLVVESAPGEGTRVVLRIPIRVADVASRHGATFALNSASPRNTEREFC